MAVSAVRLTALVAVATVGAVVLVAVAAVPETGVASVVAVVTDEVTAVAASALGANTSSRSQQPAKSMVRGRPRRATACHLPGCPTGRAAPRPPPL